MDNPHIIPVRIGEVILFQKGVVLVKLIQDHEILLQDVKEHIAAAVRLTEGEDFVAILDGGTMLDVREEAMTFVAKHKNKNWLAFAIVVRSISERLFANYYLKFKKPIRPTKAFTTPKGAAEWLNHYIKINNPLKYNI